MHYSWQVAKFGGGAQITELYRYQGFISYAHKDERMASRLHGALETYRIPSGIAKKHSKSLSPIFRDTAELTAHHSLSEKIQEAVRSSRVLIVLCSPAAKDSHWVNEEIRLFRKLHGEASILCVLAEGTPETSFPPALLEGGREPLAANLGSDKDSFKLGTTQLAASMMGVGLDTLIQRESKRRRKRLQIITASALAFSGLMGVTAFTAVEARNEAQDSRAQAERLVEYMISDLKVKLEPLGKLDILDGVGDEAVKYYNAQDIKQLNDESLMRQARSLHILAQVAINAKNMEKAEREIGTAYALTQDVLNRNPRDPISIYSHAQSEYWAGEVNNRQSRFDQARPFWARYEELAKALYTIDPNNTDWIMEAGWGQNNLGLLALEFEEPVPALQYYLQAINYFDQILEQYPNNTAIKEKSNALLGAAFAADNLKDKKSAKRYSSENIKLYEILLEKTPNDSNLKFSLIQAKIDAKSFDSSYKYNPIQELKELISHDPKNMVWLKKYLDENYEYALRPVIAGNKVDIKYSNNFMNSHKILIQNEAYKKESLNLTKAAIIELNLHHHEGQFTKANATLERLANHFLATENIQERGAHYLLICFSHLLNKLSIRDKLIQSYSNYERVKKEKIRLEILNGKLIFAKLNNNPLEIKRLTALLRAKGQRPQNLENTCFN